MAVWLLSLVFSGCLALPGIPSPHHPGQDLIDLAMQTYVESRIVGGSDTQISEYPWQASLEVSGSHICGAIILSEDFVLTAAHCVGSSPSVYTIHVGSSTRSGMFGSKHGVSSVKMHPDFINGVDDIYGAFPNDVAVMKLSEPISLDSNKKAISLTSVTNDQLATYNQNDCVITGWGKTSGNSNKLPDTLQMTNVKIMSDAQCSIPLGSNLNSRIHICVDGAGSSGGCNGDSGGPLACRVDGVYELAGVTSFVFGSCLTSYPTVYAETFAFRTWIQNAMNSM